MKRQEKKLGWLSLLLLMILIMDKNYALPIKMVQKELF